MCNDSAKIRLNFNDPCGEILAQSLASFLVEFSGAFTFFFKGAYSHLGGGGSTSAKLKSTSDCLNYTLLHKPKILKEH